MGCNFVVMHAHVIAGSNEESTPPGMGNLQLVLSKTNTIGDTKYNIYCRLGFWLDFKHTHIRRVSIFRMLEMINCGSYVLNPKP